MTVHVLLSVFSFWGRHVKSLIKDAFDGLPEVKTIDRCNSRCIACQDFCPECLADEELVSQSWLKQ